MRKRDDDNFECRDGCCINQEDHDKPRKRIKKVNPDDTIRTPIASLVFKRNKGERKTKFQSRTKQEYRDYLKKQLTEMKVSWKEYNMFITKHPLVDLNGNSVIIYKTKFGQKCKRLQMKYLAPKLKLVVEE